MSAREEGDMVKSSDAPGRYLPNGAMTRADFAAYVARKEEDAERAQAKANGCGSFGTSLAPSGGLAEREALVA